MPNKRSRLWLIIAIGALALAAIGRFTWGRYAFPPGLVPLRDQYRNDLANLTIRDGIDRSEATAMVRLYTREYINGSGTPADPLLRDGLWTSTTADSVVQVDAKSGSVSSRVGPAFSTFQAFATDLVDGMAGRRR